MSKLKKFREEKNKKIAELKSKLEEKEKMIIEKEKIINDAVSLLA